ncbi:MAG: hypothetical protein FJ035_07065 [Chloroflexi bacterium]|nr:hypothetical protein [Chloroflexota bacterium]
MFLDVWREIRSDRAVTTLRDIYLLGHRGTPTGDLEPRVRALLDAREMLGFAVASGAVGEGLALRMTRYAPLRCWYALEDWIAEVRTTQGGYARHVERYAHRSLRYQVEGNMPEDELTRLNGVNVVRELASTALWETRDARE